MKTILAAALGLVLGAGPPSAAPPETKDDPKETARLLKAKVDAARRTYESLQNQVRTGRLADPSAALYRG